MSLQLAFAGWLTCWLSVQLFSVCSSRGPHGQAFVRGVETHL
jgi:hypothetical protein